MSRRIVELHNGQIIAKKDGMKRGISQRGDESTEFAIGFQIPLEIVTKNVTLRAYHSEVVELSCDDLSKKSNNMKPSSHDSYGDQQQSSSAYFHGMLEEEDNEESSIKNKNNNLLPSGDEKENERTNINTSILQFHNRSSPPERLISPQERVSMIINSEKSNVSQQTDASAVNTGFDQHVESSRNNFKNSLRCLIVDGENIN